MSNNPYKINNIKTKKYKEYIKVNNIDDSDAIRQVFYTAFNIGYNASREYMRSNINAVNTYDECLHCGCLALINRKTLMCMDCGNINYKGDK